MTAPIPSGFKSREEYNEYMKKYNRDYRERQREKKAILKKLGLTPTVTYEVV